MLLLYIHYYYFFVYLIIALFLNYHHLKFTNVVNMKNLIQYIFADLVVAMFDCAVTLSSVEGSREDVAESLSKIGIEQPTVFLSAAYAFLMQHSKVI